jgi:hypothetical protein
VDSSQTTDRAVTTRTGAERGPRADSGQLEYLNLYRVYHRVLTQPEDDALRLIEVQKSSYAEAAGVMRVSIDDIKKLIFLARQKLFFGMGQTLGELSEEPAA